MANVHKELRKLLAEAIAGKNPEVDEAAKAAGYVHGPGWIVTSTADVARFLRLSNRQVQNLIKEPGFPPRKPLGGNKFEYDLAAIVEWRFAKKEADEEEEDTYRGNSPEAEKLRRVQREIKEIERDKLRRQLAHRGTVRDGLSMMSAILKNACDKLQRKHGDEVRKIFADAVANYEREIKRQFGVCDDS